MATPAQPVAQSVPSKATIRFTKSVQVLLSERLSRRNISLEKYIEQLIENDFVETRLELWRANCPPPPEPSETKIEAHSRREKTAARASLILQLLDEGICPAAIAERARVSLNTVHRIRREHTGD